MSARTTTLVVVSLLCCLPCAAQLDTGVILGTVFDSSGAVIAGASAVVQNQGTGTSYTLTTDDTGNFIVPALPVGAYRVTVSAPGFKTRVTENLRVQVSDRVRLDITLEPGQITERVMVSAEAPIIDTASSTLGAVVTTQQVQDLPVNGRNVMDLLQLVPGAMLRGGASSHTVGGAQLFRGSGAVRFLVDGADASRVDFEDLNNTYGSSRGRISRASIDAIQEFRVYTNSFSAEYGQAVGGVVNIITKSGTNEFHGGLFEYLRNEKLDARNYFNVPPANKPSYRLNQFGGSLGGRIVRDKLFFFGNYEGVRQRAGKTQNVLVPTQEFRNTVVAAVRPAVDLLPLPNGPISTSTPALGTFVRNVSDPLSENTGSIKGDYIIGANDRLSVRYNANKNLTQTYFGVARGQLQTASGFLQLAKVTYTRVWSPKFLMETGLAFNRAHIDPRSADSDEIRSFPLIGSLGNGSAGVGPALFDLRVANNSYSFLETMSYVTGRQQLRFGAQIIRNQDNKELGFQRTISFQNLAEFAINSPTSVGTLGQPRAGMRNTYYHFFVQDDIQISRNLTINAGLRYQYDTSPTESHGRIANFNFQTGMLDPVGTTLINAPKKNFAPRFGFAWTPLASKSTVIRGGYGLFYANLIAAFAQNVPNNISQQSSSLTRQQQPDLVAFPFPAISFAGVSSFSALPRDFNTAYSQQWNLNVQQGLGGSSMLQVAYVGNRGLHLEGPARNMNRLLPGTAIRPYPAFGNISLYADYLNSYYNALQTTFRHRLSGGLTFNLNYTWAHSLDNAPTLFGSFSDDTNPNLDYGNADGDVRHSLQFDYLYEVPALPGIPKFIGGGWQLNGITVVRTGFPIIGMSCGCDPLQVSTFTSRPDLVPGVPTRPSNIDFPNSQLNLAAFTAPPIGTGRIGNLGRNVFHGPRAVNFDLSVFKGFPITERQNVEFRAEMFNIFNTPQFSNPGGNITAPANFGRSLSTINTSSNFGTNRQIQFALRYMF